MSVNIPPQKNSAIVTQLASHPASQQVGSKAQTVWQQPRSLQKGVEWMLKQLPAVVEPQPPSSHSHAGKSPERACWAQVTSHCTSQQKLSTKQSARQQFWSEQFGNGLATQQLGSRSEPQGGAGHAWSGSLHCDRAIEAQTLSHSMSQQ